VLAQICKPFPKAEIFTLFDFLPAEVNEQYFKDRPRASSGTARKGRGYLKRLKVAHLALVLVIVAGCN
jgi:hypothetical protein